MGERVNLGDKTGVIFDAIGDAEGMFKKLEKAFPNSEYVMRQLCKKLKDTVEKISKESNRTEKAVIGLLQLYSSPGYPFHIRLNAKYVCCGKNRSPEAKLRGKAKFLASSSEDPAQYVLNGFQADINGNIADDWNRAMTELLQSMSEDCAKSAK